MMAALRLAPERNTFGDLLRQYRERAGRSRNSLCLEVGCDPSYGTRIEHGDREPPRLHIVQAFARALRLTIEERNRLYVAAGHAPAAVAMIGWDDALEAVTSVLTNPDISTESRDDFRGAVLAMAKNWSRR